MRSFQYHLITDSGSRRESLQEIAVSADRAGVHFFHLREKSLPPSEVLSLARSIRPLLRRCRLIVNGLLEVALRAGADGVHLQNVSVPVSAVRRRYPSLIVGYSAHSPEELRSSDNEGASYFFISPVFPPRSKDSPLPAIGTTRLAEWIRGVIIPVIGLGGVSVENVTSLQTAGCVGAAGISLFLKDGRFTSEGMVL
jgi:thiamine-phosphate pyrophosphorylase